jgi:hypothetical protein
LNDVNLAQPTYLTSGASKVPYLGDEPRDLKANLTYLGKYGTFTTSDGITIAFITGDESILDYELSEILEKLKIKQIDILITYQWPSIIAHEKELFFGNTNIDKIVRQTQPKYHFAVGTTSGKFFERAPFQWDDSMITTRFISLGQYESGEKWIYAFNINTTQDMSAPSNITPNPFNITTIPGTPEAEQSRKRSQIYESSSVSKRPQRKVVRPEDCFFCLSNPKLEAHMIISIGEYAYLTIAKGPLTKPTKQMNFSGHCLIIPVAHIPCLEPTGSTSIVKTALYNEILRYQVSLVKFFDSLGMATVFFQINKSDSVHFHIQCFPILEDFLLDFSKALEKKAKFNNDKHSHNTKLAFDMFEDTEDERYLELVNSKRDYISFIIFKRSISKQQIFVSEIDSSKGLDLQFGRRVLADILRTPNRAKWDKCQQSKKVEEKETEAFKELFKSYDFALNL